MEKFINLISKDNKKHIIIFILLNIILVLFETFSIALIPLIIDIVISENPLLPQYLKSLNDLISTINKTFLSQLFVIDMAEKILKKIPMGTHHYEKFIKPSEIKDIFQNHNFDIRSIKGINLNPISNNWKLTNNKSINYIVSLTKR